MKKKNLESNIIIVENHFKHTFKQTKEEKNDQKKIINTYVLESLTKKENKYI